MFADPGLAAFDGGGPTEATAAAVPAAAAPPAAAPAAAFAPPPPPAPRPPPAPAPRPPPAPTPAPALTIDDQLIAILEAPLLPGETVASGYRRKEAALGAALAALTVPEARALHARLLAAHPGDLLADKLTRLTAERRHRLLAFLADARRREALRLHRR
ncbi:MAG TPA: hypothetical protein VNO30_27630 [Kofleriaceae bacterium]|nr:hypothetical protein [Kofleriaceae bacterium]